MPPMPPPDMPGKKKKPGLVIAVGVGPKKMAPPSMGDSAPPATGASDADAAAKHSREEAHFVPESNHCKDCSNWQGDTGECSEVDGTFDPEDACLSYFQAMGDSDDDADSDPDAGMDDSAGADMGADDGSGV